MNKIVILLVILATLILISATTEKNKFTWMYDSNNNQISYTGSAITKNSTAITLNYTLPNNYYSQGTAPPNTYFYKLPLVYLFDPSQVTPPAGTIYNAAYFNGQAKYLKPTTTQLKDNETFTSGIKNVATTTLPSGTNIFKNLIRLGLATAAHLSEYTITPTPVSPQPNPAGSSVQDTGNVFLSGTAVTCAISGNEVSIANGLSTDRTYVIGVAPTLNASPPGVTLVANDLTTRRYGNFTYTDLQFVATPGYPGQVLSATVNLGQLLV